MHRSTRVQILLLARLPEKSTSRAANETKNFQFQDYFKIQLGIYFWTYLYLMRIINIYLL